MKRSRLPAKWHVVDNDPRRVVMRGTHPLPRDATPANVPAEHQFNKTQSAWELDVFMNASSFYADVYVTGSMRYNKHQVRTFIEALAIARAAESKRALVYAVTSHGRSVCIPEQEWPKYQAIANGTSTLVPYQQMPHTQRVKHAGHVLCKGCGTSKGVKIIAGVPWHPSCWRVSRMSKT